MSANFGAEMIDLTTVHFTVELLRNIPADAARMYQVIPVADFPNQPVVAFAMNQWTDLNAIDSLCHLLKRELEIRMADEQQFDFFIQRFYGGEALSAN